jgi:hypothetical protein
MLAAAALAALMTTGLLSGGRAEAMPAATGLAAPAATERVRLVCRPVWNGYGWAQRCYRTGPALYYGGGPAYYGGGGYYGPRPYYGYRRGFYGRRFGYY